MSSALIETGISGFHKMVKTVLKSDFRKKLKSQNTEAIKISAMLVLGNSY